MFFGTILLLGILASFILFSISLFPPTNPVVELTSSFRADSTEDPSAATQLGLPQIFDINLKVDNFVQGLDFPPSFVFLGPDDMLVLEKNSGKVRRIVNGSLLPEPLLSVNVSKESERGMLGIAIERNKSDFIHVFLHFTESGTVRIAKPFYSSFTLPYTGVLPK